MKKYIKRYEVTLPLGAGGSRLATYKSLAEAKAHKYDKEFCVYESVYSVSESGSKTRLSSKRVY